MHIQMFSIHNLSAKEWLLAMMERDDALQMKKNENGMKCKVLLNTNTKRKKEKKNQY